MGRGRLGGFKITQKISNCLIVILCQICVGLSREDCY